MCRFRLVKAPPVLPHLPFPRPDPTLPLPSHCHPQTPSTRGTFTRPGLHNRLHLYDAYLVAEPWLGPPLLRRCRLTTMTPQLEPCPAPQPPQTSDKNARTERLTCSITFRTNRRAGPTCIEESSDAPRTEEVWIASVRLSSFGPTAETQMKYCLPKSSIWK